MVDFDYDPWNQKEMTLRQAVLDYSNSPKHRRECRPSLAWGVVQDHPGPSGAEMLDAITDTAINSAVRSGFDAFRLTVRDWEDQTRKWRCRLPTSEVARFGVAADWRCSAINFDIVELSFDQLDAERATRLANVKTSLQLPSEEVDLVVNAGIDAVLAHPDLRRTFGRNRLDANAQAR